MGSVISSAADGLGTLVGNALSAPFRAIFGASCKDVCSGTWDLPCFIEHLCFSSLAKFFVAALLAYTVLLVSYLLCKLGIVKCVAKNACKMVWKPCSACCRTLGGACCLLWGKVRDTKRVYRGRRRRQRDGDVELGEPSTSCDDTGSSSDDGDGVTAGSRSRGKSSPWSVRETRKDRIRQSLRLKSVNSKLEHAARVSGQWNGRRHHHSTGPRRMEEHAARVSGQWSGWRHHHSTGPRRMEVSSLRGHGHGSAARGHSHMPRRT